MMTEVRNGNSLVVQNVLNLDIKYRDRYKTMKELLKDTELILTQN